MKKRSHLLALPLAALTLLACTKDDKCDPPANRTALTITAVADKVSDSGSMRTDTRATDTNWQQSDAIGVYMLYAGTANPSAGDAPERGYKYINQTVDGPSATFAPADEANTAYYPAGKAQVDVIAYYPYNSSAGNTGAGTLPVDVSDQSNLPAIDLMTSALSTGHSSESPEIALSFKHRLAKVVVKISGATDDVTALSIIGTPATATYDLMEQKITGRGEPTSIELSTLNSQLSTNIVVPTIAGSGVKFLLTAGGREYTAALPAHVALDAGKVTTVTITLSETETEITATITDWEGGPTVEVPAILFKVPDNPETGVPTVTAFRLWKNNDETSAVSYEYADGKWNATPRAFYVEETTADDRFHARHTPAAETADPVTGLTDIIEAGPSAMDTRGVIDLSFHHTNALLAVALSAGKGLPTGTDLSKATVKILGATLSGSDTGEHIFAPATIAAGQTLAVVEADGNTYTALAADDFVLVPSTRNKLNLTVSVETTGQRIIVPEVTTKPWAVGITTDVNAVRFVLPDNPSTGVPAITGFTVYKNGNNPTLYTYKGGQWSASPQFFLVEDIQPGDQFTAEAIGTEDPISKLTDILRAPAATMTTGGIINLEFAHTLAQLNIRLYPGDGLPAGTDLSTAQVEYQDAKIISYQGADASFLINPKQFNAGAIIVRVTVGGNVYESKLSGALNLEAGTRNTLNIILKVEQEGKTIAAINATQRPWTELTPVVLEAINMVIPQHPSGEFAEVAEFVLHKNPSTADAMRVTYKKEGNGYVPVGSAPYYVEDVLSTDKFYARYIPTTGGAITGIPDAITTGAITYSAGVFTLQFKHAMSQIEFVLDRGAGFTSSLIGGKVEITLIKDYTFAPDNTLSPGTITDTYTFTPGEVYTVVPQAVAASINVKLGSHTYKAIQGITLTAGDKATVTLKLMPTEVGISVEAGKWNTVSGNGMVKQDIASSLTATNLSGNGELTVITGTHTGVYTYTHATKSLITKTPLYWDDLSGSAFNFVATFTPIAAGTPEKDVLSGSAINVGYGTQIDFGKLTHDNAKLKMTLTPGTGYSVADMQATTLSVTGLTASVYAINTGQEYIFKPKTFVTTDVITITTPLTTYTLKMSDIQVDGSSLAALAAGSAYTVDLTVSKSGVGVAIDVKDWTNVDGTGSVGY